MSFDLYDKTGGLTPDEIGDAIRNGLTPKSLAELSAYTGMSDGDTAYLSLGGRSGDFIWTLGDFSAEVAADPLQGVYVESDTVAATVGCWVRKFDFSVAPYWHGATGEGTSVDYDAVVASISSLSSGGHIHAGAGHFNLGGDYISWSDSESGIIGQGIGKTIFESRPDAVSVLTNYHDVLRFTDGCENVLFQDLTFIGTVANAGSGVSSLRNIVFNRVRFTTSQDAVLQSLGYVSTNGLKFTTNLIAEGIEHIYFIDCEWVDCGRMGCEIFSGIDTTTVQHSNIHFVRPKFIRSGRLNAAAGQGLSLDGYAEGIWIQDPYFDGNAGYQLENIGCSRLTVQNMKVRASTLPIGVQPILYANVLPMYDCLIDGLFLLGEQNGAAPVATPVAEDTMVFQNVQRFTGRNWHWNVGIVNNERVAEFSSAGAPTYYPSDITLSDMNLTSAADTASPIALTNCEGLNTISGKIKTTSVNCQDAVGVFGTTKAALDFSYDSAYTGGVPRTISTSGTAEAVVSNHSMLSDPTNGVRRMTQFDGTLTLLSGTKYIAASHLLPGTHPIAQVSPKADIGAGIRWFTQFNSSIVNAQTDSNVAADKDFAVSVSSNVFKQ